MATREHAHRAWVLVDPVQDYEESLTVLGAYGTDKAARFAGRDYMRRESHRDMEAQEWRGDDLLRIWTWSWRDRKWSICYRGHCPYPRHHDHAEIESAFTAKRLP